MKRKILTLQQSCREGAAVLEKAGIERAALDAWLLLSHVTGISRADFYGHPERVLREEDEERYRVCIQRRSKRIPLQHITGEQEFMGYTFRVNEHVLIPRQDTETLVEEALGRLKSGMHILDICTGSGCVLISLLKTGAEQLKETERKEAEEKEGYTVREPENALLTGVGTDISGKALETAKKNAEELGIRAEFTQSDLFEQVSGKFDMIVSNPPYIPTDVIGSLQDEVRLYDPYIALDGKEDGLYFYRKIIKDSVKYIKRNGFLLFETGCDQGEAVSLLMKDAGYSEVCIQKDLAGLDRVVSGSYNKD